MVKTLFPSPPWPSIPVKGETAEYPVHRIFCVGKNYAAHAAEMGGDVDREQPIFFTKSALAFLDSGEDAPYPPGTSDYHYEVELVAAIGAPLFQADPETAAQAIYGYGVGLDMTRRDLQARARDKALPWDVAKDAELSAIFAPLTRVGEWSGPEDCTIRLSQNGTPRQEGRLDDMVWSVPELLSRLSGLYHLMPGDVVLTGTPAGVGPVQPGDRLHGEVDGLSPLDLRITEPE